MSSPSGQETIRIPVSREAASIFRQLPKERRELIESVLVRTLESAMNANGESLADLMEKARKQAKERGLTPETLQQILD